MPKLKTNKAFKKRFRVTKRGKALASHSLRRHLLADRSAKKKRQTRATFALNRVQAKEVKRALPYG